MADSENELISIVEGLGSGDFLTGATRQLKSLVAAMKEAVRNNGGTAKGKFSINLTLEEDGGIMEIRGAVKVSEPSTIVGKVMRYGTEDGELLSEDPRQHILALGRGPVRDGTPDVRNR